MYIVYTYLKIAKSNTLAPPSSLGVYIIQHIVFEHKQWIRKVGLKLQLCPKGGIDDAFEENESYTHTPCTWDSKLQTARIMG